MKRLVLLAAAAALGENNSSEVRVHLGAWQNMPPYPRLGDVLAEFGPHRVGFAADFPIRPWMIRFDDTNGRAEMKGDWDWEAGLGRDQIAEVERFRDCARGNFQRTEKGAR